MNNRKKISSMASMVLSLLLFGTIGYMILLEVNLIDALYMTVITISTVGYGEISQMDNEAKLFSILLIFISLGTVGYLFSSIVSSLLEGDLKLAWRRKNMEKNISSLKNHYIICGAGETGLNAIKQFEKSNVQFVVIDKDEKVVNKLLEDNILVIHGDSTDESVLEKAKLRDAKGFISTLPDDADNVYTILTARSKSDELYIVSRAIEKNAASKLIKAGANNTISPNEIGGNRMAAILLRPTVISFLDIMTHVGDVILDLEDVKVEKGSSIDGKKLREAKIPEKTGLIILAINQKKDDDWIFNPNSDVVLKAGDSMIVLGTYEQVDKLKNL